MLTHGGAPGQAERVLDQFCRQSRRVSVRRFGKEPLGDYTYHVRLRDREAGQELVNHMESIEGVQDVTLVLQEELSEV